MHRVTGTEVPAAGGAPACGGQVRVFRDVAWERRDAQGARTLCGEGYMQLEYRGPACGTCRWLQFVRSTRRDRHGLPEHGVFEASGSWKRHGEWYVDAFYSSPQELAYDAHGMANRSNAELSIFDAPSLEFDTERPGVAQLDFEALLVCSRQVVYGVQWSFVAEVDDDQLARSAYGSICGGPAQLLPRQFQSQTWRLGWANADVDEERGSSCSEKVVLSDPIDVEAALPGGV